MKHEVIKLDAAGYRKFGLVTGLIFIAIFGLILPWVFNHNYPVWPWVLASILSIQAIFIPLTLGPVYKIWMKFGYVLNWINTRIILGILFYGLIFPVGILLKLLRKVPISKSFDSRVETYRKQSHQGAKENMERPF